MKSKSLRVTIRIGIVKDTLHSIYSSACGMTSELVTMFHIRCRAQSSIKIRQYRNHGSHSCFCVLLITGIINNLLTCSYWWDISFLRARLSIIVTKVGSGFGGIKFRIV